MHQVLLFPLFEKEPKLRWFSIEDKADFQSGGKKNVMVLIMKKRECKEKNKLYEVATFTHKNRG